MILVQDIININCIFPDTLSSSTIIIDDVNIAITTEEDTMIEVSSENINYTVMEIQGINEIIIYQRTQTLFRFIVTIYETPSVDIIVYNIFNFLHISFLYNLFIVLFISYEQ